MEPLRSGPHSYIVRVWIEHNGDGRGDFRLRGHVCYVVVDGAPVERSFTDLNDVPAFIRSHLRAIGVIKDRRRSTRHWLTRLWGSR
jgi:hypothetical protein